MTYLFSLQNSILFISNQKHDVLEEIIKREPVTVDFVIPSTTVDFLGYKLSSIQAST